MYRILLGFINSPDLTMYFSFGFDNERTVLDGFWLLLSHFNFEEYFGLLESKEHESLKMTLFFC